jgi:hypothetical protein
MSHHSSSFTLRSATFYAVALLAACGGSDGAANSNGNGAGSTHTIGAGAAGIGGAGGLGGSATSSGGGTAQGGNGGASTTETGTAGNGTGGSVSSSGGGGGGGAGGGASTSTAWTSTSSTLATCAADSSVAEQIPLDMYIMLDQSGSMKGSKWTDVTSALKTFVGQGDAKGIGVGIQYFGLPGSKNCDVNAYATPEVPIAPLPGVAQAIIDSINAHSPSSGTPTLPALQGALQHAANHATANPTHAVIVVLATDGAPSGCNSTIDNVAQAATAGANGTPKIPTYVIGVGNVANLDTIAQAGGTGTAFIASGQNVNQQFLDAMNDIRGKALGCTYVIPEPQPGELLDYEKINVEYVPGDLSPEQTFGKVDGVGTCPPGGDGWYYNDNQNPATILLCPSTCTKVSADAAGQIKIAVGCQTIHD